MKAGIAVDKWKLPIFGRHLTQSGYSFKQADGLTADTALMMVETENFEALYEVLKAAAGEAVQQGVKQ